MHIARPMFATDLISVWERRKPWYAECSTHEFIVIKEETEGWDIVEKDLVKFAQHLLGKRFESPGLMHGISTAFGHPSFFLSLTFPDVKVIDVNLADKIFDGINAVELRVDLLSNPLDLDYVGEQLAQLRRLLLGYSSLPIIFTVRTKEQGGRFPSENFGKMAELLSCAVKWGCEFIDVEILDQFGQVLSPSVLHPVLHAISAKGHSTKIIASFHDVQGRMSWDKVFNKSSGGLGATSNACPPSTSTTITTTTTSGRLGDDMKDIYSRLATYGDVVKIIGVASSLQDNFELEQAVTSIKTSTSSHEAAKPLIALNMKSAGQLSRALNTFLTPVTHPNLPVVAAPGQISVKEINQLRHLIQMPLLPGGCEMSLRRCYYLFGKPISHSFSPTLHNTGFDALGLPFTYGLHESDNAAAVVEFIKTQVKLGLFGGSSVTIPLKEELLKEEFGGGVKLFGRISDSVSKIGAVNTIGVVRGEAGKDALWADNTGKGKWGL